jgi:hypothetical protein
MKIIPAGKYESALVRLADEIANPNRNTTGHQYYMDLNRLVGRDFIDGVGTFIALSEQTIVPWELDWSEKNEGIPVGLNIQRSLSPNRDEEYNRHYDELEKLIKQISSSNILSSSSFEYITSLDLHGYSKEIIDSWNTDPDGNRSNLLRSYLRRLLHQIYTTPNFTQSYILMAEPDIQVLAEIGEGILSKRIETNIPFPNLQNRLLEPNSFAHGVLNFSPRDLQSIDYVRNNKEIRQYSEKIRSILDNAPAGPEDPAIIDALIDAHYRTEAGRKAKTVFEIGTWIVKPLHYLPVIGEVLSVAEDLKDVAQKVAEIEAKKHEWCFIGVRMHTLAIEEYLKRLSDNMHPALRQYRENNS